MTEPRIQPVDVDAEGLLSLNVFRTLARHEKLSDRFGRFGGYLLYRGLLPSRERELVILRTGWRSNSEYEFGQHTLIGREAGLADEEISRLAQSASDDWAPEDRVLVEFVDELCATNDVSDQTWEALATRWSEPELIELLVLAGFYRLVSGFLNGARVQLEPGTRGWPSS